MDALAWGLAAAGVLAFLVLALPHLTIQAIALGSRLGSRLAPGARTKQLALLLPR